MKKKLLISFWPVLFSAVTAFCQQTNFSLATDMGVLRSFKKEQRFWAEGQTIHMHLHFTPKEGAYWWLSYYTPGKFTNKLAATAKLPATSPQQVNYLNNAEMRLRQVSIGWKQYLKGSSENEESWNLYAFGGFGLIMGSVVNAQSVSIDTALYNTPVQKGKANFKRLTLDLGIGWEVNIGGAIFLYNEGKVWIPASDYPSEYVFINRNAPLTASVSIGIRVLFD